ncbi:MAG: peroxide stress protein YaaA [Flavobacteriales bacterium]|nr:peroxide stress protein YaaA [Flavobacteriales bacterium]
MLIVLSPAKDLDTGTPIKVPLASSPLHLDRSAVLAARLRTMSAGKLAKLMDISPKLAELNRDRWQNWTPGVEAERSRPAVFLFNGEVYRGLDAYTLSLSDLRHAQQHLRILSGLYGLLRPLDRIQPHRLEMGTRLVVDRKTPNLYAFWKVALAEEMERIQQEQGTNVLVNLASAEYFKAISGIDKRFRVVTPIFKDVVKGQLRTVMLFAKHQRGNMARFAIQRRLRDAEGLRDYREDGYRMHPDLSTKDEWVFVRSAR